MQAAQAGSDHVGGRGDDVLWGDGTVANVATTVLDGGADSFVFNERDGRDMVMDFRSSDGDIIHFTTRRLEWSDLDSNRNGRLDDADRFVAVDDGDTRIAHGSAAGPGRAGGDVLTVAGVTGLTEADFLFG